LASSNIEKAMTNTQFSRFTATPKIDQTQLLTRYVSFLKLQSIGFPSRDARQMSQLTCDLDFEKAKARFMSLG
jgi:hypothetical protein